jgi:hypothetical protein
MAAPFCGRGDIVAYRCPQALSSLDESQLHTVTSCIGQIHLTPFLQESKNKVVSLMHACEPGFSWRRRLPQRGP